MLRAITIFVLLFISSLIIGGLCMNDDLFAADEAVSADNPSSAKIEPAALEEEYNRDLNRLIALRKAKNLDGLERFAEEIQAQWSRRDERRYFALMSVVVQQFTTYDFAVADSDRQYMLAQKYARLALQKADKMPLEVETLFLSALMADPEYRNGNIRGEQWIKMRSEKVKMLLEPLQRIEQGIDKNYDFKKNAASLNVQPPEGVSGFSGMSPANIADPKLRAEYELAIAENNERRKRSNTQRELRRVEQQYLPLVEKYLIAAYSKPPHNTEELKQHLNLYVKDEARKARVLKGVEEVIQRNAQAEKDKAPQTVLENAENE